VEFEAMLKVFFADQGTLEQLRGTLDRVAAEAEERLAGLLAMAGQTEGLPFPERTHISALGLTFAVEQERTALRWARWALDQVADWESTSDPGPWDARAALDRLATVPSGAVTG
jgi:hypothetical protein